MVRKKDHCEYVCKGVPLRKGKTLKKMRKRMFIKLMGAFSDISGNLYTFTGILYFNSQEDEYELQKQYHYGKCFRT